jgi:D-mannonate dehydratase
VARLAVQTECLPATWLWSSNRINGRKNKVMAGMQSNKITYTPIEEAIKKHNEIDKDLLQIAEILQCNH